MTPWLDDGDVSVYLGDCIEVMAAMPADSVDAVVCDPPYGLEFMGKEWDRLGDIGKTSHGGIQDEPGFKGFRLPNYSGSSNAKCRACGKWQWDHEGRKCECARPDFPNVKAHQARLMEEWHRQWAAEAFRVLKPGGHLLAFGGTRTFHRLTCGLEDAGFEIRDCLSWLYGSGFPKSLDVSKAIDKRRDDREDVLRVTAEVRRLRDAAGLTNRDLDGLFGFAGMAGHWTTSESQPAVPTIEQWATLRDVLAPPDWLEREVWRLNGRKGEPGEAWHEREVVGRGRSAIANKAEGPRRTVGASKAVEFDLTAPATDAAREWQGWGTALKPAWEPCVVARKPLARTVAENVQKHGTGALNIDGCRIGTDGGGTHCTNRDDDGKCLGYDNAGRSTSGQTFHGPDTSGGRWPANVALDEAAAAMLDAQGGASRFYYTAKASRADRNTSGANNTHPTVKPTDLMRWLVRLVTPPGGVVLDPFAGSGSTLVAARAEGVRAIGIEQSEEYAGIIRDRLAQLSLFSEGMPDD